MISLACHSGSPVEEGRTSLSSGLVTQQKDVYMLTGAGSAAELGGDLFSDTGHAAVCASSLCFSCPRQLQIHQKMWHIQAPSLPCEP